MDQRFAPVPVLENELLKELHVGGLRVTESWHKASSTIGPHAHRRVFRATYGVSPGEYLRQLRVDWAAEELRASDRSLAEVAVDAGFSDQSHFTRVFKATFGTPPGAWRRATFPGSRNARELPGHEEQE